MNTPRRAYWSERTGKRPKAAALSADVFRALLLPLMHEFEDAGLFQEALGYDCVDAGWVPGSLGPRINDRLMFLLGHKDSWPLDTLEVWDDDQVFDMIEFLYDHVSAGVSTDGSEFHNYNDCGWHYSRFTKAPAQSEFQERVNELLARYDGGYELDQQGQIVRKAPDGIAPLIDARLPGLATGDADHVANAIHKFRSRSATRTDRRDAVRDLADVLESIRGDVSSHMFSKDEAALFEIANKFWIRHNKPTDRRDYDHEAWWSWLFYLYLDSIALVTHLKASQQHTGDDTLPPTSRDIVDR